MKLDDVVDGGSVVSGIAWFAVTDVCFVCIEILYCRPLRSGQPHYLDREIYGWIIDN